MTSHRLALGAAGEDAVAQWYTERGWRVLARNWRCRDGELDVIVCRGSTIVVCEVKTRSSPAFGSPLEAVTRVKQARIRRLAGRWLAESGHRAGEVRFDVASVLAGRIEIVEAAF